jgi:hypothetical protein
MSFADYSILERLEKDYFYVYHRTKHDKPEDYKKGFVVGKGAYHGAGLYSTQDVKDQMSMSMLGTYGPNIVEFKVKNTGKFIILDYRAQKKISGGEENNPEKIDLLKPTSIEEIEKMTHFVKEASYDLISQLKKIMKGKFTSFYKLNREEIDRFNKELFLKGSGSRTADIGNAIIRMPGALSEIDGIVYSGFIDGNCVLIYNTDIVTPARVAMNVVQTSVPGDNPMEQPKAVFPKDSEIKWEKISANINKYVVKCGVSGDKVLIDGKGKVYVKKDDKKFMVEPEGELPDEMKEKGYGIVIGEDLAIKHGIKDGDEVTVAWKGILNKKSKIANQVDNSPEFISGFNLLDIIDSKETDEGKADYEKLVSMVGQIINKPVLDRLIDGLMLNDIEELKSKKRKIVEFIDDASKISGEKNVSMGLVRIMMLIDKEEAKSILLSGKLSDDVVENIIMSCAQAGQTKDSTKTDIYSIANILNDKEIGNISANNIDSVYMYMTYKNTISSLDDIVSKYENFGKAFLEKYPLVKQRLSEKLEKERGYNPTILSILVNKETFRKKAIEEGLGSESMIADSVVLQMKLGIEIMSRDEWKEVLSKDLFTSAKAFNTIDVEESDAILKSFPFLEDLIGEAANRNPVEYCMSFSGAHGRLPGKSSITEKIVLDKLIDDNFFEAFAKTDGGIRNLVDGFVYFKGKKVGPEVLKRILSITVDLARKKEMKDFMVIQILDLLKQLSSSNKYSESDLSMDPLGILNDINSENDKIKEVLLAAKKELGKIVMGEFFDSSPIDMGKEKFGKDNIVNMFDLYFDSEEIYKQIAAWFKERAVWPEKKDTLLGSKPFLLNFFGAMDTFGAGNKTRESVMLFEELRDKPRTKQDFIKGICYILFSVPQFKLHLLFGNPIEMFDTCVNGNLVKKFLTKLYEYEDYLNAHARKIEDIKRSAEFHKGIEYGKRWSEVEEAFLSGEMGEIVMHLMNGKLVGGLDIKAVQKDSSGRSYTKEYQNMVWHPSVYLEIKSMALDKEIVDKWNLILKSLELDLLEYERDGNVISKKYPNAKSILELISLYAKDMKFIIDETSGIVFKFKDFLKKIV